MESYEEIAKTSAWEPTHKTYQYTGQRPIKNMLFNPSQKPWRENNQE